MKRIKTSEDLAEWLDGNKISSEDLARACAHLTDTPIYCSHIKRMLPTHPAGDRRAPSLLVVAVCASWAFFGRAARATLVRP
jgi:hypothetical protein